jgi:hypothetical protein
MKRIKWLKKELKESLNLWSHFSCDCLWFYIKWLREEIVKIDNNNNNNNNSPLEGRKSSHIVE